MGQSGVSELISAVALSGVLIRHCQVDRFPYSAVGKKALLLTHMAAVNTHGLENEQILHRNTEGYFEKEYWLFQLFMRLP